MTKPDRFDRQHQDNSRDNTAEDTRSPAQHDRDRILYSPEFRRLSGITQVISPSGNHPAHNRLTHTLEVAQIARSITRNLTSEYPDDHVAIVQGGGLDADVVEAAALAHDIGHPPFGHVTEEVLNDVLHQESQWGFEGNAQTFRILTKLSIKDDVYKGLNLTRATLSAVGKYPWLEERTSKKWGAYESERDDLDFSRAHLPTPLRLASQRPDTSLQTLEARIMDWADDVAYAIHDVDDFFRVGMIPLDRLKSDERELARFLDYHVQRVIQPDSPLAEEDLKEVGHFLLGRNSPFLEPFSGSFTSTAALHRRSSSYVHRYIVGVKLDDGSRSGTWGLAIDDQLRVEVDILKSLLWYYVIDNRALLSLRYGYASLIAELFHHLLVAAIGKKDGRVRGGRKSIQIFPESFRASLAENDSDENVYRVIADLIASLTETQAIELHHRLTGIAFGKSLDRIV